MQKRNPKEGQNQSLNIENHPLKLKQKSKGSFPTKYETFIYVKNNKKGFGIQEERFKKSIRQNEEDIKKALK